MAPATFRVDPSMPRDDSRPHARAGAGGRKPAAILVAHGMGQQAPFRTLDDVMAGLRRHERERKGGAARRRPVARTVVAGDQRLQRLEAVVTLPDGSEREVHVYEAYWAPLTEGQITLRDVLAFLFRSGVTEAVWGLQPFRRWLFDDYVEFPVPVRTILYLVVALAVTSSLVFLNTLIAMLAAARAPLRTAPAWLSPSLFSDVTTVLDVLVVVFIIFALSLALSRVMRGVAVLGRVLGVVSIGAFVLALWTTMAAAVTAASLVVYHALSDQGGTLSLFDRLGWAGSVASLNGVVDRWLPIALLFGAGVAVAWWLLRVGRYLIGALRSQSPVFTIVVFLTFLSMIGGLGLLVARLSSPFASLFGAHALRRGLAWPVVVLAALLVRSFLIQYVGDVAAYVQPQVLDRFSELRQKIKDTVWQVARAVYSEPYDDVILVGHSLGSVVIYDALNRLLIDEAVNADGAPPIAGRTRLLLTFGSPLDKTAFIFGVLGRRREAREALAASVQPLIADPAVRPRWINIYSRWDLISGSLDYYDRPDRSNRHPVENVQDPRATTLIGAHVEYWDNALVFDTLLGHLGE